MFGSFPSVFSRARWGILVRVECSFLIKPMVAGLCSIRDWCYSWWWVWDLRTLTQFQGSVMPSGLSEDFMDGYIKFTTPLLLIELGVPIRGTPTQRLPSCGFPSKGNPIQILWVANLLFSLHKICVFLCCGGVLIVGGWGVVRCGRKLYFGPAVIASFVYYFG